MLTRSTFLILGVLTLFSVPCRAQIHIGADKTPEGQKAEEWKNGELEALRASTTLLVVPNFEKEDLIAMQKALDEVWTLSTIKVCAFNELGLVFEEYQDQPLSFISLSTTLIKLQGYSGGWCHFYLDLTMPGGQDKKGRNITHHYAKVVLHPDAETLKNGIDEILYNRQDESESTRNRYLSTNLDNLTPHLIINYLKYVNDLIDNRDYRSIYKSVVNKDKISRLKNNTLYILDNVAFDFSWMKREDKPLDDPSELLEKYPYKAEFISKEMLEEKLSEDDSGFYYLIYVRSSTDKFVAVYHSTTGELIYSDCDAGGVGSRNFESGDLAKLAKAIK